MTDIGLAVHACKATPGSRNSCRVAAAHILLVGSMSPADNTDTKPAHPVPAKHECMYQLEHGRVHFAALDIQLEHPWSWHCPAADELCHETCWGPQGQSSALYKAPDVLQMDGLSPPVKEGWCVGQSRPVSKA